MSKNVSVNVTFEKIAQEQDVEESTVKEVASKIFEEIVNLVKTGNIDDKIRINNFGKFVIYRSKEKRGINPRTKERLMIPAKKRVKFRAFGILKDL